MKKPYLLPVFVICLLVFSFSFVNGFSIDDIRAQILALQTQVQELQLKLSQILGSGAANFCYDFKTNLKSGSNGNDVSSLQKILRLEGFGIVAKEDGIFSKETSNAVIAFQEKYSSDILARLGLKKGTGLVAQATRNKLNSLYGCKNIVSTPTTTPIPTISAGPTPIQTPTPTPVPTPLVTPTPSPITISVITPTPLPSGVIIEADYPSPGTSTRLTLGQGSFIGRFKLTNNGSARITLTNAKFTDNGSHSGSSLRYALYASSENGTDFSTSLLSTSLTDSVNFGALSNPITINGGSFRYLTIQISTATGLSAGDNFQLAVGSLGDIKYSVKESDLGYDANGNGTISDTITGLFVSGTLSLGTLVVAS